MKPRVTILFVVIFYLSPLLTFAQSQEELLLKYWYYRDRLKYFVVPGEKQGEGDMAGIRNRIGSEYSDYYNLDFGQNGVYTGYYLGILATEYRILKDNGYDDQALNTEKELIYALRQYYNFLDKCEDWWNMNKIDDGYFIRTAVPFDFGDPNSEAGKTSPGNTFFPNEQYHYDILNYKLDISNNGWNSSTVSFNDLPRGHPGPFNYQIGSAVTNGTPWHVTGFPEVMSEDEAIGLLMGFALIYQCMPDATLPLQETNKNAQLSAQEFAVNIIDKIWNNYDWRIYNHPDPALSDDNDNAKDFAYGYAAAANWFSSGAIPTLHYFVNEWNECQACGYWNLVDEIPTQIYNSSMMCTLAAIGNSWYGEIFFPPACPILLSNNTESTIISKFQSMGIETFYLLLYQVLHPDIEINSSVYPQSETQLNDAPFEGPYHYYNSINSGNGGWAYSYKWRGTPTEQVQGRDESAGTYSGCDYMLFYNLYLLATSTIPPDYHNYSSYLVSDNWPILEEDNNTIFGNYENPLYRVAFSTLSSDAHILSSTRFDYQQIPLLSPIEDEPGKAIFLSETEVKLQPGFICEKGTDFLASISPHVIWEVFSNNNFFLDNSEQIDGYYTYSLTYLPKSTINKQVNNDKPEHNSSIDFSNFQTQGQNLLDTDLFLVFPNPADQVITIVAPESQFNDLSFVHLTDIQNKLILKSSFHSNTLSLDVSKVASGFYTLTIVSKHSTCQKRIIIQ